MASELKFVEQIHKTTESRIPSDSQDIAKDYERNVPYIGSKLLDPPLCASEGSQRLQQTPPDYLRRSC